MQCVLLNADYSFLNIVDWRRAICLMIKNKVEVVSYSDRIVKGAEGLVMKVPAVIKLIKFIRAIYRTKVNFSKRNILIRDGFRCVYCGKSTKDLTLDHIIPRSRGGKSTFENCVACCKACNHKKGGKTPSESNMFFKIKPYHPTISEFFRLRLRNLGIDDLLAQIGLI
ncbi:MAG: HNH endonuclease [Deltaproteobacteria bacterium]|nr:HNH endonuclease [Deltaproteobacteria bacterium]MBW1994942.1 HNH endonuclease [Deltaproteobacteria bacterium]MBW2154034.1 HNH endonuclease [Deltaproteobacteria bacterium]